MLLAYVPPNVARIFMDFILSEILNPAPWTAVKYTIVVL